MIWILVAIYILILAIELPSLIKKRLYRELGTFSVYFVIGLYMSLAFYYGWPLAGPFEALASALGRIGGA